LSLLELFGIVASVVIALSLMMRNLKRLRLINLAGSLLFALYGLGIGSLPVFLVNVFIVGIDLWYLIRMRATRADFALLHLGSCDSEYLKAFIAYHEADIRLFWPGFSAESAEGHESVFVLRDTVPASLALFKRRSEDAFDLLLDYAVPAHRDYKSAEFFFSAIASDLSGGRSARFYERTSSKAHIAYLKRLGFVPTGQASSLPGEGEEYLKTVQPRL
jgi:hypothetical protein